jgi:hypothetical protein
MATDATLLSYAHGVSVEERPWMSRVSRVLASAAREVRMLSALTPLDAQLERERLIAEVLSGRAAIPRWTYARRPQEHLAMLRRALDAAFGLLDRHAAMATDWLCLERLQELSLEAKLCEAAGTPLVGRLARVRFPAESRTRERASELGATWLREPEAPPRGTPIVSDDPDERSLLSQMRAAAGAHRLPFAVVVQPALAALAATGDEVILVGGGRPVHDEDARRTVLHEIEGHARPRARSQRSQMALLRAGTARGIDHQEGRALLLEERAGLLGPRRKRQLAARHWAVEAMIGGATFADVVDTLAHAHGVAAREAVVVAERQRRKKPGPGSRACLPRVVRAGARAPRGVPRR